MISDFILGFFYLLGTWQQETSYFPYVSGIFTYRLEFIYIYTKKKEREGRGEGGRELLIIITIKYDKQGANYLGFEFFWKSMPLDQGYCRKPR